MFDITALVLGHHLNILYTQITSFFNSLAHLLAEVVIVISRTFESVEEKFIFVCIGDLRST